MYGIMAEILHSENGCLQSLWSVEILNHDVCKLLDIHVKSANTHRQFNGVISPFSFLTR